MSIYVRRQCEATIYTEKRKNATYWSWVQWASLYKQKWFDNNNWKSIPLRMRERTYTDANTRHFNDCHIHFYLIYFCVSFVSTLVDCFTVGRILFRWLWLWFSFLFLLFLLCLFVFYTNNNVFHFLWLHCVIIYNITRILNESKRI